MPLATAPSAPRLLRPQSVALGVAVAALLSMRAYALDARLFAFAFLAAAIIAAARLITNRLVEPPSALDAAAAAAVIAFASIVGCGLLLGTFNRLTLPAYLLAHALLVACALALPRSAPAVVRVPFTEWREWPSLTVGIVMAFLVVALAFAIEHSPYTLYDSLSYHLYFPARWLQEHRLSIIPTPFSDPAQAYAPGNGELFLLWLMLPLHSDSVARLGQVPFALAAAIFLYAIARRLGAAPAHAIYPPVFMLLSRPVLEQAIGANVDLICGAMFLASLYWAMIAVDGNRGRDWVLAGVAAGLYVGTKYVAVIYAPALLFVWLSGRRRREMLWAAPGLALFAAPWYLRNWIVAGSPIYPASFSIGPLTIARGAFDRAAMMNTVFHVTDKRLFVVIAAHALGPTLACIWIPAAAIGSIALVRRGWWPHTVFALLPWLMVPLFWFGLPVNIDSRFLMPAVLAALLPFAFVFRRRGFWNVVVHAAYLAAVVWILVGVRYEISASGPWFMRGWLALDGLLSPAVVTWCGALAAILTLAWRLVPRRTPAAAAFATALVAVPTVTLAKGADRWCSAATCEYLDVTSPYLRANLVVGWRWLAEHVHDSSIAYSGINLPYPLTGTALTNRVLYVNIDGRSGWRLHDYDRALRAGEWTPVGPALASRSGELLPLDAKFGPTLGAIRPRFDRIEGNRDAWRQSLRREGIDYLFLAALSAYEVDNVWHNSRGFPVEDEWASADPALFHLAYENPQVRVFAVDRREDGR